MRLRLFTLLTAGSLVAGAAIGTGPASASHRPSAVHRGHAAQAPRANPNLTLLYDQNNNDTGVAIVSQNFEPTYDQYDTLGADDFRVAKGQHWALNEVDVTGTYFNGAGPAASETVSVYADAAGVPGALVKAVTKVGTDNGFGSFVIPVGNIKLRPHKRYWISVRANMDLATGGEWGWNTRTIVGKRSNPAVWENPGGGFALGCATFSNMQTCLGAVGEGPDFMFTLRGTIT